MIFGLGSLNEGGILHIEDRNQRGDHRRPQMNAIASKTAVHKSKNNPSKSKNKITSKRHFPLATLPTTACTESVARHKNKPTLPHTLFGSFLLREKRRSRSHDPTIPPPYPPSPIFPCHRHPTPSHAILYSAHDPSIHHHHIPSLIPHGPSIQPSSTRPSIIPHTPAAMLLRLHPHATRRAKIRPSR